jgi:hypothetical protein
MAVDDVAGKPDFEEVINNFNRKNKNTQNVNSSESRTNHSVAAGLVEKKISEIDLNQVSFQEYFSSRIWRIHAPWIFSDIVKAGVIVLEPVYKANFELRKIYRDFSEFIRDYNNPSNGKMRC